MYLLTHNQMGVLGFNKSLKQYLVFSKIGKSIFTYTLRKCATTIDTVPWKHESVPLINIPLTSHLVLVKCEVEQDVRKWGSAVRLVRMFSYKRSCVRLTIIFFFKSFFQRWNSFAKPTFWKKRNRHSVNTYAKSANDHPPPLLPASTARLWKPIIRDKRLLRGKQSWQWRETRWRRISLKFYSHLAPSSPDSLSAHGSPHCHRNFPFNHNRNLISVSPTKSPHRL